MGRSIGAEARRVPRSIRKWSDLQAACRSIVAALSSVNAAGRVVGGLVHRISIGESSWSRTTTIASPVRKGMEGSEHRSAGDLAE